MVEYGRIRRISSRSVKSKVLSNVFKFRFLHCSNRLQPLNSQPQQPRGHSLDTGATILFPGIWSLFCSKSLLSHFSRLVDEITQRNKNESPWMCLHKRMSNFKASRNWEKSRLPTSTSWANATEKLRTSPGTFPDFRIIGIITQSQTFCFGLLLFVTASW